MNNLFNQDFQEYIELLNKHQVKYVLLGGYAVNYYGYRRTTGDLDLFVKNDLENHNKLKQVHTEFGMPMGEMEDFNNFKDTEKYDVYTFGVQPCQIDILTASDGITFDEAYESSKISKFEELSIRIIHYNKLKKTKLSTSRLKDKADIEELEKIRQFLKQNKP